MKKILLISALYNLSLSPYRGIGALPSFQARGFVVPLNLATIAALTPDDIEIDCWDETVHGMIDDSTNLKDYDLVGISCFVHHLPRAKEIAKIFRSRGIPVAIGGSGVASAPERCRDDFDILFIGEAEFTWPQFIKDWKANNFKSEYRQITKIDMADSPIPRWDIIGDNMKDYIVGAVQTARGCPFDCDFCDVIYLFGRRQRHKPIEQVLQEIRLLQSLDMHSILFCDDNFTGNTRYAKELLRELIALNRTFEKPLAFQAQISLNIAKDEELLELLADANFSQLLIGIESPNKESLEEVNKTQNLRGDLVEDVKKIQSYGLFIKAAMIVGFDHDDKNIFDLQFNFLQEVGAPLPSLHILEAPDSTRLWARLYKEGRILQNEARSYAGRRFGTNIIPKRMSRVELFTGYAELVEKIYDWHNFAERVKRFVSGVKRQPDIPNAPSAPSETALDRALFFLEMAKKSGMMDALASTASDGKSGLRFLRDFFLIEDEEARNIIFDLIRYTIRHAPFMLDKVVRWIALQYGESLNLPSFLETIHQQIEAETTGAFVPKIACGDLLIPEGFKHEYKEIFPQIHQRVYLDLNDKTRTGDALIEVFTDFLIRWGKTFEQFDKQHQTFLYELADRAIAKENSMADHQPSPLEDNKEEFLNIKNSNLADEILKAVEQGLRGIQPL